MVNLDMITFETSTTVGESGIVHKWHRWSCGVCRGCGSWLNDVAKVERMAKAHAVQHQDGEVSAP